MTNTITTRQLAALQHWQLIHGRHWRAELLRSWGNGVYGALPCDHEATLQGLRNARGPGWLASYRLEAR